MGARSPTQGGEMNATQSKVAFLVAAEGIEKVELTDPWQAVTDAGYEAVLISPDSGTVQLFEHLDKADTWPVDVIVSDAAVDDYAALVLPGGVANPDALRADDDAVGFIRDFVDSGKPVAAICHAPGCWSRRTPCAASASPHGPACRPTSATPAGTGWTSRTWSTAT